jgi:hypothetical protein
MRLPGSKNAEADYTANGNRIFIRTVQKGNKYSGFLA